MPDATDVLRGHLLSQLKGGQAFDTFDEIVAEVPKDRRFETPKGMERSAWQIVEHMARALEDLNEFSDNADGKYKPKDWPKDYWPEGTARPEDWDASIKRFKEQLKKMEATVQTRDLFEPFAWGDHETLLREALLASNHTAYHLGELVMLTRALKSQAN